MAAERIYYTINEKTARTAKEINSFSDYRDGSATEEYRVCVDKVYDTVDLIAEKRPHLLEKATRRAERYSRKLAEYYNDYYRNEASCPSILISGGSNFPTRKKEKQNSRRDTLMKEWQYLEEYARKIQHMLTMQQPILSSDENAIEMLEEKLESLTESQELMKSVNAFYRKNKTLEGCPGLSDKARRSIEEAWAHGWYVGVPFPSYSLSNNNSNIKRVKGRLEKLKNEKARETAENGVEGMDGLTIKENVEDMRIQLFFEDKPEPEIRDIMKGEAFHWSNRNGCWQRQLTDNGRRAAKRAIEKIRKLAEG